MKIHWRGLGEFLLFCCFMGALLAFFYFITR